MTSNGVTPHGQTGYEHTWQTLIEFDLSTEPGGERLAVDRVAEAVQGLNWPVAHLKQLKVALAEAARQVMECDCCYDSEAPLAIRVLISGNNPATREADPAQHQASEGEAQQAVQPISRGWSFFLIEKSLPDSGGGGRHVLELYLYPGGK